MSINQFCILHHLAKHPGLTAAEIAEDGDIEIGEVKKSLHDLLVDGVVEQFREGGLQMWRAA